MAIPYQIYAQSKFIIDRMIDADTLMIMINIWDQLRWHGPCRLAGINAYELDATDGSGEKAKEFTDQWIAANLDATLEMFGPDKYRRPLIILRGKTDTLNDKLVENGHAVRMRSFGDDLRDDFSDEIAALLLTVIDAHETKVALSAAWYKRAKHVLFARAMNLAWISPEELARDMNIDPKFAHAEAIGLLETAIEAEEANGRERGHEVTVTLNKAWFERAKLLSAIVNAAKSVSSMNLAASSPRGVETAEGAEVNDG